MAKPNERLLAAVEGLLDVLEPWGSPGPPEARRGESEIERQQREIDRKASVERRRLRVRALSEAMHEVMAAMDHEGAEAPGAKRRSWVLEE